MVSMQEIIAFLWNLMRDDEARTQFEQDPTGTLAHCGLTGVTARDIQDAQMVMQDSGLAQPRAGGPASSGSDSAVEEIRHTSVSYEVNRSTNIEYTHTETFTVVDIDDRDTIINGDMTNNVTAIQDNDTINADVDVINVEDSFNDGAAPPVEESPADTPPATEPSDAADPDSPPQAESEPEAGSESSEADPEPDPEPEPEPASEPTAHEPCVSESAAETVESDLEDDALVG